MRVLLLHACYDWVHVRLHVGLRVGVTGGVLGGGFRVWIVGSFVLGMDVV